MNTKKNRKESESNISPRIISVANISSRYLRAIIFTDAIIFSLISALSTANASTSGMSLKDRFYSISIPLILFFIAWLVRKRYVIGRVLGVFIGIIGFWIYLANPIMGDSGSLSLFFMMIFLLWSLATFTLGILSLLVRKQKEND